jgi:hypothetical protein
MRLKNKLNETELKQVTTRADEVTSMIGNLTEKIGKLRNRVAAIKQLQLPSDRLCPSNLRINERFHTQLPIVVANGNTWAWSYYVLVVFHVITVLVGFSACVPMLFGSAEVLLRPMVENVALYWHFSAIAWIMIFGLLFLF